MRLSWVFGAALAGVVAFGFGLASNLTVHRVMPPVTLEQTMPNTRPPAPPKLTVVIDPGHGGIDSGMSSRWVTEKTVALDVSLKLRARLEANGVRVILTRTGDSVRQGQNGCDKRCDLEARANFASADRNVFVSVHVNAAASSQANGVEVYTFGQSLDAATLAKAQRENGGGDIGRALTAQATTLARNLLNDQLAQLNLAFSARLADHTLQALVARTGARNLGRKRAAFWVIRRSRIPAVLVEIGFGSNPVEGAKLATQAYRSRVAQGIAEGVLEFLGR
jgi:N-acetylmuramoyl-L-alanine amidase